MSQLPIRVRMTLIAAVAMGCLFTVLGVLLYIEFQSSINTSINDGLRARADALVAFSTKLPPSTRSGPAGTVRRPQDGFAQILSRDGAILVASAGHDRTPLLRPAELAIAAHRPFLIDRGEDARLYAIPARGARIVVVGVSLAQQQEAFITFNWELVAGIPTMLLLASTIAYLMFGRLLRPVEEMRRRAEMISPDDVADRLPLPPGDDEVRRLAVTLNEMLDRLHTGIERERLFVSDASHELRGPLAVLKGELEVALRTDGSAAQWREAVGSAVEETDRVIKLANDLLVLARGQAGELLPRPERLDAGEVLARAAARATASADGQGRRVRVSCRPGLTLIADRTRLEQALDNLVDNALVHGAGELTLSARECEARVELHVGDRGEGFPEDFLPHAFERFRRADQARGRGGAGLGLSIVEAIARGHGGVAGAANRPGGGADVWISLPRAATPSPPAQPAAGPQPETAIGAVPATLAQSDR
ncbi:MAG: sensor histidine kinase [Solirubrobacteraceae bacterium]